ncbi:MAG: hypothetical protein MUE60_08880, partial [Candidatus Eisenbacteria bacterium]|nr:hypothetical protein [Candidatus Eisenbacteria bacterium]
MENRQSRVFRGLPVAEGVALGRAFLYTTDVSCVLKREIPEGEVEREIIRFIEARESVGKYYQTAVEEAARDLGPEEAEILRSHLLIVRDPHFVDELPELIRI